MREGGFALFRGKREEEPGGEHREHAGNEGAEDDPEEGVQAEGMLARHSPIHARCRSTCPVADSMGNETSSYRPVVLRRARGAEQ